MSDEMKELFNQRLGRYQAAIALEPTDRVPIALNTCYYAEETSGYDLQQIMYDPEIWTNVEIDFARKYPEVDTFRTNLTWAPAYDAVDYRLLRIPGRDLSPRSLQQFVEAEYMKADEYRMLIDDRAGFVMERYLPRVLGEFLERGSTRSYIASVKSALAQGLVAAMNRQRAARLAAEVGMPVPVMGGFAPPFDAMSDKLRGLNGIMLDMFRQPDNVIEACEALLPDLVTTALAGADPERRYPIFIATHKPCFLSPKQFDTFYWPTFKRGVLMLIEAGYTARVSMQSNWASHWHHMTELPKGKVLCDLDNESDIFKAKEAFGHQQCIAGGIPNTMFIFGTPDEICARVKLLCETVGKDGGWIVHGGANIPADTKPENFRAMIDAIMEYGRYSDGPAPKPKYGPKLAGKIEGLPKPRMVTPWEVKKAELGTIQGDEDLIRQAWEMLEKMAYNWLMSW